MAYIYIYIHVYACLTGLILGLLPANEIRRYKVTPSIIGWAQTWNQLSICVDQYKLYVWIIQCKKELQHTQWSNTSLELFKPVYCECLAEQWPCYNNTTLYQLVQINSLWPSDTTWPQSSGSTMAQVMACCSLCLNQCWLLVSTALWH